MKKMGILFTIFVVFSFFVIANKQVKVEKKIETVKKKEQEEMRALFVSYMELNTYIQDKTEKKSKENIENIIKNTKKKRMNTIILQVRSFDDAIYKSKDFKVSKSIILQDNTHYDVLDYFIKVCQKENMDLYLWVNPFRITRRKEEIEKDSFAYSYKDSDVVKKIEDIYYYNPASSIVQKHIIEGIKELIQNYKCKGILFDDYFYPDKDIDKKEYEEYKKEDEKITQEEYHLKIVSELIENVYKEIKKINKKVEFGISPDGNIENNYNKNFADVKLWAKSDKYIDFLMPQLYYGFTNQARPFYDTLKEWNAIVKNKKIKLYYALAFYKIGLEDQYAKEGREEWIKQNDIIKRQIILSRNAPNYHGFSLFRYDNLFNETYYTENTLKELENLEGILKMGNK